jgi:multiple sugar transport system permease protein
VADIAQAQTTRRDALREAEPEAVRSWNPSDGWMAFLFTFPTMALLVFIGVFPLIWSLGLSFTRYDFTRSAAPAFVGILNYARVLDNAEPQFSGPRPAHDAHAASDDALAGDRRIVLEADV